VHRTESVSVMDHEQTMGVNSRVSEKFQKYTAYGHLLNLSGSSINYIMLRMIVICVI